MCFLRFTVSMEYPIYSSAPLCKHNYMANKLCSTHGQLFLYSIDLILCKTYNYVQKSQCALSVCIVCLRYSTLLNIHTEFGFGFASSKSGVCGTCTMPPIIGNNNYHNEIELSIYYRDRASERAYERGAYEQCFACKYQGGAFGALPINTQIVHFSTLWPIGSFRSTFMHLCIYAQSTMMMIMLMRCWMPTYRIGIVVGRLTAN